MTASTQIVLSLGSNQADSQTILQTAVDKLASTPGVSITAISGIYLTKPVGNTNQPDFLNVVVLGKSSISANTLLRRIQTIETQLGRVRDRLNPKGPRTIDIDIVKFGEQVSNSSHLTLPHPAAKKRAFVLVPWLEVEPCAKLRGQLVSDLVANLDKSDVLRVNDKKIKNMAIHN